jgi:hypothetical protein
MSETLKAYVLSLSAQYRLRVAELGSAECSTHEPSLVTAFSEARACELGLAEARQRWPEAEGYYDHTCTVGEASASVRQAAYQLINAEMSSAAAAAGVFLAVLAGGRWGEQPARAVVPGTARTKAGVESSDVPPQACK